MEFNSKQSVINLLELNKEVRAELVETLDSIEFIRNLVSPDRKTIADVEKDEFGKAIVDITNPHILENTDYFRPAARHFEETKEYTSLPHNTHPLSDYKRFWAEEARRCRQGYVREDGEWVTGYHYFYLNYSPILLSTRTNDEYNIRVEGFPRFWDGDYLYFHYIEQARKKGKHTNCLKTRGRGYSFKGRSELTKVFILGDRQKEDDSVVDPTRNQKAFAIANEKEFLIKDGILNKFVDNANWCAEHTPWPRNRNKDSLNEMRWIMGYKDRDSNRSKGVLNEVIGVSLKNDPQKARGKRGPLIIWEEMGKFPGLLQAWRIATPSVQQGSFAFGQMQAFGTGGTNNADFTAAEEMFYRPDGYNIYALPNVFDKNVNSKISTCAFFHGEYLNREGCMDENGNSNVTKALLEILKDRVNIKMNTSDPNSLVQHKAEMPLVPQEAIMRREGSLFPILDLKEYLGEIASDVEKFTSPHYIGNLYITGDGTMKWRMSDENPIREFPLKDNLNKIGAVEIFQQPIKGPNGQIPWLRYIIAVDPYDDDYSTTTSLGSIFVFDRFHDQIVAEYTGRPTTANEFYEIAYRLGKYYNAIIGYENDKKGLFAYFSNRHALHMLADTPQILRDMEYIKDPRIFGNKSKGIPSGKNINAWGRKLQADWMRSVAVGQSTEELRDDGTIVEVEPLLNLQKIRSLGYIREAIAWNPDGNFDRVSAMGICMIMREELAQTEARETMDTVKTKSKDDFFSRRDNYSAYRKSYIKRNLVDS